MMRMGSCQEDGDIQAKLAVLEEIKALMDSELGSKLKPEEKGLSVEKVSVMPGEEEEDGMEMDDKAKLKELYQKLMG